MNRNAGRLIFFNGTVMRRQPAHDNLRSAQFLRPVRTASKYRLFSIRDKYPAMIATSDRDGISVPGELYFVPDEAWAEIEESEPYGLFCDRVELSGGEVVFGMLGTPTLVIEQGSDISFAEGWVAYIGGTTTE